MSKKIIGIPGWSTGDNSFGATKTYIEWMKNFGDPVIIMPWQEFVKVDLLILPGGADLNPANYHEPPSLFTQPGDVFKEFFYRERLPLYIQAGIPIFGICLGHQMLNAYFGGTIEQHLAFHPQSPARRVEAHKIFFYERLPRKIQSWNMQVNSHHHQGVLETQVAPSMVVLAVENEKKLPRVVEAMRHKELPIASVQFHPEELDNDGFAANLVKEILGEEKTNIIPLYEGESIED